MYGDVYGTDASMLVSQNQYAPFRKSVLELVSNYDNHVIDDVQCFERHKLVQSFAALLNQSHRGNTATAFVLPLGHMYEASCVATTLPNTKTNKNLLKIFLKSFNLRDVGGLRQPDG